MIVVYEINMDEVKTKTFKNFLVAVGAEKKAMVVTPEVNQNVILSSRNIPGCKTTFANLINVYDIVNSNKLVVDKAAVAKIEEVFA